MKRLFSIYTLTLFVSVFFSATHANANEIDYDANAKIASLVKSAIADKVINGAAIIGGNLDSDFFSYSAGFADSAKKHKMDCDTIIDIASVTKVAATITALLICRSRGLIDFDAPFTDYIKDYKPLLTKVPTVRELANHTSGFIDVDGELKRRYFDESGAKMMDNMLTTPPPIEAGKKLKYCCWNYILLSIIVERITGEKFDDFCRNEIFAPLGMDSTSLGKPVESASKCRLAQTIGTAKCGEISDFVASRIYRDGFACGNAGMFTSARDFTKLVRCYLREGKLPNGSQLFSKEAFAEILPDGILKIAGARHFGWSYWEKGMDESKFGELLAHSGWSGQTVCMNVKTREFAIVFTTRIGDYDRAKRDRFKIAKILLSRNLGN